MPSRPRSTTRSRRPRPAPRVAAQVAAVVVSLCWVTAPAAAADEPPPGVWPLEPRPEVVHGFDPPEVRWGSGHRGVDLAGRTGQPVRAALPGTVTFAGRVAGRGVVVVDHGGTRTTYEPVTATVGRGTEVGRGQVIGTLAWFGTHCLPAACLHWGLRAGETYLDPLQLVGGPVPVRLLPLDGSVPRAGIPPPSAPPSAPPDAPPDAPSGAPSGAPTGARVVATSRAPGPALAEAALAALLGAAVAAPSRWEER